MADGSSIEWTDATWNPITGCSVVSPGCTNCYAMRLAGTRLRRLKSRVGLTTMSKSGPVWNGTLRFNIEWLDQPKRWRRPRKIFVCAHGDLFHEKAETCWMNASLDSASQAGWHEYQFLTKRPHIALDILRQRTPKPNWLIGVSVEDQKRANERFDDIATLAGLGWRTFVSYEPALEAVDWASPNDWSFLSWMISGGESGPGARPTRPDWHRATRDWCAAHGTSYLFKQWGAWLTFSPNYPGFMLDRDGSVILARIDGRTYDGRRIYLMSDRDIAVQVGKRSAGRLLDGVEHNGFPQRIDP